MLILKEITFHSVGNRVVTLRCVGFNFGCHTLLASGSRITADVDSAADGSDIKVTAERVILRDRAWISSATLGAGDAGNISITARDAVLSGTSNIFTETWDTGKAGDVSLAVTRLIVEEGAQISLNSSRAGRGGKLRIDAKESVIVTGKHSRRSLLASNAMDSGAGGDIEISAPFVAVRDGGAVQAGSQGAGVAGRISLTNVNDALRIRNAGIRTATDGADG
ncbi:MAG: hypothetical protein GY862_30180, partial [Gammaproteobacteria bacterium]|nr:hypothetical protein [Gammaproteobacteria bacterium]